MERLLVYRCHGVTLIPSTSEVFVFGRQKSLTAAEQRILRRLMANQGRWLSRDTLLDELYRSDGYDRRIDSLISHIRRKLFMNPKAAHLFIQTGNGIGYRIPSFEQLDIAFHRNGGK